MGACLGALIADAAMAASPVQVQLPNPVTYPWYTIPDNIRGSHLMSANERSVHIYRLQAMKTFDECKTYMHKHYVELEKRALDRRVPLPPIQMDPCEMMRMTGYFK